MFDIFLNHSKQKEVPSQLVDGLLEKRYRELVEKDHLQHDAGQLNILGDLQQLLNDFTQQNKQAKKNIIDHFLAYPRKKIKSIYLFGDVGRGKSMLMDVFYEACPTDLKRRVHFHAFMQEVHEYMFQWRKKNQGDPIPSLAIKIKHSTLLLCFDEFQVTDIADAMLLSRLFTQLLNEGVVFVATSNQHPDDLYKNGLQRELFLPFIAFLKQSANILELVAKEDYRLTHFKTMETFFFSDSATDRDYFIQQCFNELTNDGRIEAVTLSIKGREISFVKAHGDILSSSFEELCGRALGAADYLTIASEFNTILIADIPGLSLEIRDKVRRFVTLIDTLYEKNVKLICSIAVPVEQLYLDGSDFDFKRTQSRLHEMQSEKYLQRRHLS